MLKVNQVRSFSKIGEAVPIPPLTRIQTASYARFLQADVELDRLRYTVRLCHEIGLLSQRQYRTASGLLAEVGKLLGTWIKRYNRVGQDARGGPQSTPNAP